MRCILPTCRQRMQKKCNSLPSPCPLTLSSTADGGVSPLLVSCLSQFEFLDGRKSEEFITPKKKYVLYTFFLLAFFPIRALRALLLEALFAPGWSQTPASMRTATSSCHSAFLASLKAHRGSAAQYMSCRSPARVPYSAPPPSGRLGLLDVRPRLLRL